MAERVEVTRDIDAPPEAVYDAVADATRMGQWSAECHTCEWHDGVTGPAVGVSFALAGEGRGAT